MYKRVRTPLDALKAAESVSRRLPDLRVDAKRRRDDVASYAVHRPHLVEWPFRHARQVAFALLCLLPLFPDPLIERPLVEELLRLGGVGQADVATWTWRFVVSQILLIGGLSWLGALGKRGARWFGFLLACGVPVISVAVGMQNALSLELQTAIASGATAPVTPSMWAMLLSNLGLVALSFFSMGAHLFLWYVAPSVVDGTVEVVHALKWQVFKIKARWAAKTVAETDDEAADLVASALNTAKRSKETVGTSGLSEQDLMDKDLQAFLRERGLEKQFAAVVESSQKNGVDQSTAH